MTLTRERTQMINREAQAALEEVARKHNLKVVSQGGSYAPDGANATFKFMFTDQTTDGTPMTPEFLALRALHPEIAGYTFYVPGKGYIKMLGYNSRAKKYPYLYEECASGKIYKTTAHIIEKCTPERREDA